MGSRGPRYRLLVADIDGTLLDSQAVLRPSVLAAIDAARQTGMLFTLATGRRYSTTRPILRDLGLGRHPAPPPSMAHERSELPPVVLQTGALVASADGYEVLFRNPVPIEDARRALRVLVELGLQPIIYEDRIADQMLITGPEEFDTPAAHRYLQANPQTLQRRPYAELLREGSPLQLAVIGDRPALDAAIPHLKLAHCRTIISYSTNLDSYFMEVFHKGCSKGHAVDRLARYLGLSLKQTVCIGDNWNDVEMLAMAGCGLAVANAAPGIAPYARRLAPSNDEDAVALIIEQILAGLEPGRPNPGYDPALRG